MFVPAAAPGVLQAKRECNAIPSLAAQAVNLQMGRQGTQISVQPSLPSALSETGTKELLFQVTQVEAVSSSGTKAGSAQARRSRSCREPRGEEGTRPRPPSCWASTAAPARVKYFPPLCCLPRNREVTSGPSLSARH